MTLQCWGIALAWIAVLKPSSCARPGKTGEKFQEVSDVFGLEKPQLYLIMGEIMGDEKTNETQLASFCAELANGCSLVGSPDSGGIPFAQAKTTKKELRKAINSTGVKMQYEKDAEYDISLPLEVDVITAKPPWNLDRVGARPLGTSQGAGVDVFILDTGIRFSHQEFKGDEGSRADGVLDFTGGIFTVCNGDQKCAIDEHGHGTHCASVAVGRSVGVAPAANARAARVHTGSEGRRGWEVAAFNWLASTDRERPTVASISLGSNGRPAPARIVVENAVARGITVVNAAGNGDVFSCYKAYSFIPSVISVGATRMDHENNHTMIKWERSNWGYCTNVWAPGLGILSASNDDDEKLTYMSGTSMACPHVAGAAALLLGENTSLTPADIRAELTKNGEKGKILRMKNDKKVPLGKFDANVFLKVGPPPPTPSPQPTPPTPKPGSWELFGNGCRKSTSNRKRYKTHGCIATKGKKYRDRKWCVVNLYGNISVDVIKFRTEEYNDILWMGGKEWSGKKSRNELKKMSGNYSGTIEWFPDESKRQKGWIICQRT